MALIYNTGWEHQVTPTSVGAGFWDNITGTGCTIDTTIKHAGTASVKIVSSAASNFQQKTISSTVVVVRFWLYMDSTPTVAANVIFGLVNVNGNCNIGLTTAGIIRVVPGAGTAVNGPTLTAATWYRVDARFDTSGANAIIDWCVNGVPQTQASQAQATASNTAFRVGNTVTTASSTSTFHIDDFALATATTDYPIGDGYGLMFVPTGKGTHVPGAGAFQNDAAVAVTDASDGAGQSWLKLDEIPANTTDWISQTAIASTGYLEYTLSKTTESGQINGIRTITAVFSTSATATNSVEHKLTSGGTVGVSTAYDTTITANTLEYHANYDTVVPGTSNKWDANLFNNATVRIGYGSDVTPIPQWSAIWVEVDFSIKQPLPKIINRVAMIRSSLF